LKAEKLTVIEALSQGYFYCGEEGDWQGKIDITDSSIIDFSANTYFLAERQPSFLKVTEAEVEAAIMDILYNKQENLSVAADLSDEGMKDFEWSSLANQVNAQMSTQPYYLLTKVRLGSNSQR
jgi:hypothetical protein